MMTLANFRTWQNNTAPSWWDDPGLRRNVATIGLLYWCCFSFGYDGSLLSGLQALPQWKKFFNHPAGSQLGIISASYYFPKIVLPPVVALVNDRFGRRFPILIGAVITLMGAIVCAFSKDTNMLIGGRVLLGAGYSFHAITAAPMIGELAHPRLRAVASSGFLSFYYLGSVTSSWFCFAMTRVSWQTSNWTWRLPSLLQGVGPVILIVGWYFLPESPRYNMENGRQKEAIAFYEKYHANGASIEHDELVRNEVAEISESIELSGIAKATPYTRFFKTVGNRKRLMIILVTGAGTQLSGNGIITFYLPSILKLIGITSATQVNGINGGLAIMNLIVAVAAASQVERLGRRTLWLTGVTGMLVSLTIVAGLSGSYAHKASVGVGGAVIAFLYIFYAFYDMSFTALPYLYIPEILPFAIRSKGMAIFSGFQSMCVAFNQYVNPVALDAIAWKYYFVYIGVLVVLLLIMAWKFPETKGRTPEEITSLFDKDAAMSDVLETDGLYEVDKLSGEGKEAGVVHDETMK